MLDLDLGNELNEIDAAVTSNSTDLLGKECLTCRRILAFKYYQKDHTFRDGHRDQCIACASVPRMSIAEHTARLRESNNNSMGVRNQRWAHQDDYRNDAARVGRTMNSSDFVSKLRRLLPCLYITEGGIHGDLSVFRTYGGPQKHLGGKSFEYLWYIPTGILPEYSLYEFDNVRDVPVRESQRGWRTPLLRLIKAGYITEAICDAVFGKPSSAGSTVWYRELYNHRNDATA